MKTEPKTTNAKPLPTPDGDFYRLKEILSPDEQQKLAQVRKFMEGKVAPIINEHWAAASFPFDVVSGIRELGIVGAGFQGYGCAGHSSLFAGFVAMEIARVDCSVATFFGVHSGLAMGSIYLCGSEGRSGSGCRRWRGSKGRLVRSHRADVSRAPHARQDDGKARGDTWTERPEEVDQQRHLWRRHDHLGARPRRQPGEGSSSRTSRWGSRQEDRHKMALRVVKRAVTLDGCRVRSPTPPDGHLVPRHRACCA
jgi:glutaryl-CoA dehydrogenase